MIGWSPWFDLVDLQSPYGSPPTFAHCICLGLNQGPIYWPTAELLRQSGIDCLGQTKSPGLAYEWGFFKQWWGSLPHKHAMKVWRVAVHAVYGTLWTERRSIILNDQSTDEILLWNRSISFVASWAKNCSPCIDFRSNMFLLHVGLILFFWEDLYMLVTVSIFSNKFLLNKKEKDFY